MSSGSADRDDRTFPTCAVCGAALEPAGAPCPHCGAAAPDAPDPDATTLSSSLPDADEELELIRSALGADYEIVEELGRGGMAVVYRARERALERDVAVKVGVSLAFGFVVAAMVYTVGHVSGAHLNPAVTVAFWAVGRIPGRELPRYVLAQVFGAGAAAGLLHRTVGLGSGVGTTVQGVSIGDAWIIELALTLRWR